MIADLFQDLRFAVRGLWLRPAFSALVVLTLALGIAANVAIFSLVNAALLRPLPVRAPEELVLFSSGGATGRQLGPRPTTFDGRAVLFPRPVFERLRKQTEGLLIAARDSNLETSIVRGPDAASDDPGESAEGRCVSQNFFEVLGVSAYRGRTFDPDADPAQGESPVVVLSHALWERRYASDESVLGRAIRINGTPYTVIGVTPPGFAGASADARTDFWVPFSMANTFTRSGSDIDDPRYSWLQLFGRLEPKVSRASAEASADVVLQRYMAENPERSQPGPSRIDLIQRATGFSAVLHFIRYPLLVLMTGVALLLLVVCLSVSHLLLARAVIRQQEMTLRAALGATRGRLVRQLLGEGFVLAGLGGAMGALLSPALLAALSSLTAGRFGPHRIQMDTAADERVVLFTLAVSLSATLVLGLVPAWHGLRGDLRSAMHESAQSVTASVARQRLSRTLLVSQVAFSFVLLVSASLLASSLIRLSRVPIGLDEKNVLMASLDVGDSGVDEERSRQLYEEIPRRIAELPGVVTASVSHPPVLGGGMGWTITFPGTGQPPKGFGFYIVSPGYFETLGMRMLRGRGFRSSDSRDAHRVAVVNEKMAEQAFGGREAIGQSIQLDGEHDVEVIGVVSNARSQFVQDAPRPLFYLPVAQPHGIPARIEPTSLEVRGQGDPTLLAESVRRAVAQAQTGLLLTDVRTLKDQVARSMVHERVLAWLAGAFGLSTLFLLGVGLYGVISQWVTHRRRELGIRMALGATPGAVRRLVLRQGIFVVLIGLGLGVPAAIASAELLHSLLLGVDSIDAWALVTSALPLAAVALVAAYLPARRASRVDPVLAMRCE